MKLDDIVIGSGQAGPFLAQRLAASGRKVAIIEREHFGGTCVNTGCTPTKTMVASAEAAHRARDAARFGVHVSGDVKVSLAEVKARADTIVISSRTGIEKMLAAEKNCTIVRGSARFVSNHAIEVNGETLEAERFFINVGARAVVPKLTGVENTPFLTNKEILALTELPEHLLIVGGGYIGLEFGQMFRRFGSRVTVVEMGPRLASHEDPDVSDALAELFRSEDIALRLNAKCIALTPAGSGVSMRVDCTEGAPELEGSHVLLATGRMPNTDSLNLAAAGIASDARGYIAVDDTLQTNVQHIWALGDCNGRGAFTHTSYNDFEIAAANLIDGGHRKVSDRIQAHALYTDPPLGQVGMTETEVRKSGCKALIATRAMSRVGRAVEKGESFGFMKVLVDAETKLILGASILGVGGDEAIHSILDIMYARAPYTTLQNAVHIHPTVTELIPTLLGDLTPLS